MHLYIYAHHIPCAIEIDGDKLRNYTKNRNNCTASNTYVQLFRKIYPFLFDRILARNDEIAELTQNYLFNYHSPLKTHHLRTNLSTTLMAAERTQPGEYTYRYQNNSSFENYNNFTDHTTMESICVAQFDHFLDQQYSFDPRM
jgi:hypothetical protein